MFSTKRNTYILATVLSWSYSFHSKEVYVYKQTSIQMLIEALFIS